jgi:outer membrane protein assembly factor BamE (lipoprotein component of BamABCDE complex)
MSKILSVVIVIAAVVVSVSAQTRQEARQDRTQYTDAKGATLKIEIPAAEAEAFHPHTAYSYRGEDFKPGVVQVGPRTTYLKEGLTTDEVVRLLGKPVTIAERTDDDVAVTIYEFTRSEDRVLVAEFVKGKLVRSTTETRKQVAQANR